jgi:hypothetical protein
MSSSAIGRLQAIAVSELVYSETALIDQLERELDLA